MIIYHHHHHHRQRIDNGEKERQETSQMSTNRGTQPSGMITEQLEKQNKVREVLGLSW